MKQIKFDLPIDGTKVRTIEELREHFSTEILDLYKNGLLLKWLTNQRYSSYAQAVGRLLPTETDANLLKLLCGIFEVDVDFEIIQQLADYHGSGIKIDPEQLRVKKSSESLPFDKPYSNPRQRGYYWFNNEYVSEKMSYEGIKYIHKSLTGENIFLMPLKFSFYVERQSFAGSRIQTSFFKRFYNDPDSFFGMKCGDLLTDLSKVLSSSVVSEKIYYEILSNSYPIKDVRCSMNIEGDCKLYKKVNNFFPSIEFIEPYKTEVSVVIAYMRFDI